MYAPLSLFEQQAYVLCITGQKKYSEAVYNASVLAFQAMPLAAIVNKQFFCVHGGLSPELHTVEDLQKVRPSASHSVFLSAKALKAMIDSSIGSANLVTQA
jgi:hypothetical protein